MENLAFKIRRLREMRNLTQEYVAHHLGLSVKTYQRLEAGKSPLSLQKGIALVQLFEISLAEFQQFNPDTFQFEISSTAPPGIEMLESLQKQNEYLEKRLKAVRQEKERLIGIVDRLTGNAANPPK